MLSTRTAVGFRVGAASELGIAPTAIADFYAANWARKIALGIASFYRWQFIEPPGSGGLDHCCVAVDTAGAILGVMGAHPRPFVLAGKQRRGAEMTTWVVAESARGRGVGRAIMQSLQTQFDVLLGAGITDAAIPLYMAAGFRFIRHLPRFVRVYRDLPAAFARISEVGHKLIAKHEPASGAAVRADAVEPGEAENIAAKALRPYNHFLRDADNLAWRYSRHPVFSYEFYRIDANSAQAVVGLRTETVEDTGFAHVVEVFAEPAAQAAAIAIIDAYCAEHSLSFADFTCTASALNSRFLGTGWFSIVDDKDVQIANLFQPPEFRPVPTTSLMLWSRHDMPDLLDFGRLYFTKGDLDLDRPTQVYYEGRGLPLA